MYRTRHIERVQALVNLSHSALSCHSNETVNLLQIRPIVHNQKNPLPSPQLQAPLTIPPSYIRVRAVVWECDEGQTDIGLQTDTQTHRHTDSRDQSNIHFASATPHAKRNKGDVTDQQKYIHTCGLWQFRLSLIGLCWHMVHVISQACR